MKNTRRIFATGMVVAALTVTGISAFAAEDITDTVKESVSKTFDGLKGGRGGDRGNKGQHGGFNKAVEEGILTEAEAEAIAVYRQANKPDMEALKEELDGMTKEEAKAYKEANYPKSEDPLADLVEENLLSQEQADALEVQRAEYEANRPEGSKGENKGKGKGQGNKGQHRNFDQLVEEGILSEAEAEAIEAYHEANKPDMEAIKESLEGMTKEEVKAYMEANYPKSEDPLADLVEQGLLTQAQADELKALKAEKEASRPERVDGEGSFDRGQGGRGQRPTTIR